MATSALLEPRVTDLELAMAEAFRAIAEASATAREASRAAASALRTAEQTSREMAEFKNEMAEFKDEMAEFKDEMAEFKNEMSDFKETALIDREEARAERREMNRRWGALANKMGTMAEDLVAPSIPRIMRTILGCPDGVIEQMAVRVRRRSHLDRGRSHEFDVIAACGDYFLINETKSSLDPKDVSDFVKTLSSVREFFPEQADRQIVGVIASLYVDESLARHAERNGLIVLSFGEDGMDVRNTEGFRPHLF